MALGLRSLADKVGKLFTGASQGVSNFVNKPRGPNQVSLKQAVQMTAPTVARDFGNTLAGRDKAGNIKPGPNLARIPGVKQLAAMSANTGQTIGQGVVDVARGTYQATIKPGKNIGIYDRLKGLGTAAYGAVNVAKTAAAPVFQGANILAEAPGVPQPVKRAASGVLRGMTGNQELAPTVKKENTSINVGGNKIEFDPAEMVGQMFGFTKNPLNQKIFKSTEGINLLPKAKGVAGKAANFLLTNITRGGIEDTLMSIKDIPENVGAKEKAKFIRDNFLMGAASETIFAGGVEGGQKAIKSAMNRLSDTKLSQIFDEVRKSVFPTTADVTTKDAVKQIDKYLRDARGRFMGTPIEGVIAQLAKDPKADLAKLTPKIRKAVNEYRFDNDIKFDGSIRLIQDPKNPNKYLRDQRQLAPAESVMGGGRERYQQAAGLAAGIQPETDEEGRLTGKVDYNPTFAVAGVALSNPQMRKVLKEGVQEALDIDPKVAHDTAEQVYRAVYNSEADPVVAENALKEGARYLEKAAKDDFREWSKQLFDQEGATLTKAKMLQKNLDDIGAAIKENTGPSYVNPEAVATGQIKDIGSLDRGWKDVFRNFKQVFGDQYAAVKQQILDPFDASKGRFIDDLNREADGLEQNIVKGLGIKKGSKESAAVQLFGEGKLTTEDLVRNFGQEKANKIIQADAWFQNNYSRLLDEVNAVRAKIYPGNEEKLIPKRENYYRHFQEMSEGFAGLKNIFETPAAIAPSLAGTSEFVKPKSKWLSFAQARKGDQTTYDAVGGFINYLNAAEYAKNIDPNVNVFRQLRDELIKATEDGPAEGKLNNFIEFLDDFSNDLAGKTNPIDRALTKLGPSRKALKVLDWVNSRVKANMILGNLSSAVAQAFNVPQGLAEAGPVNSAKGLKSVMTDVFAGDDAVSSQSTFLKERYKSDAFDRFDEGILSNAKKFAAWMTGALDQAGTNLIWHSNYQKALGEGVENPVKYADDITREMVAGRGIGEVPLAQKSKLVQLFMPFQLEVGNTWHVMKGWADQKAARKFLYFTALSFLMNRGAEQLRGSDVSFDPLNALLDGLEEYQDESDPMVGAIKGTGRVAGEVLSNIPGGQTVASLYPEKGFKVGGEQIKREDLFGEGDPTRFGGGMVAMKGVQDPVFKLLTPFGGAQAKKTLEGADAVVSQRVDDQRGNLQFPVSQSLPDTLKSLAFGKYATAPARFYFDNELQSLTEEQTAIWQKAVNEGQDPVKAWAGINRSRLIESLPYKMNEIARNTDLPPEVRRREITEMIQQYKELNTDLERIGNLSVMELEKALTQPEEKPKVKFEIPKEVGNKTLKVSKGKAGSVSTPKLTIKKQSSKPKQQKLAIRKAATVQDYLRS